MNTETPPLDLEAIRTPAIEGICNRCREEMDIPRDYEPTAICHDCAYNAIDSLISEVERLRNQIATARAECIHIVNFPVHSEPIGCAYSLQAIATKALEALR